MATTYTDVTFSRPAVFATGYPGAIKLARTIDVSGLTADTTYAFVADDVIKLWKLPAGAIILGGGLSGTELDDHATPTLTFDMEVYDGSVTKVVLDEAGTWGAARQNYSSYDATYAATSDALGYQVADDDFYVRLEAQTGAAADAAASATLTAWIEYTMNVSL